MKIHWPKYKDSYGFLSGKDGEGVKGLNEGKGDRIHRTCSYLLAEWFKQNKAKVWVAFDGSTLQSYFYHTLKHVESDDFFPRYARHPDYRSWASDYDRLSRDQATPLIICMAELGQRRRLFKFMLSHIARLGFMYNTRKNGVYKTLEEHLRAGHLEADWDYSWKLPDFTGPEFWAIYIRGFRFWPLYPLLFLFDLETLIAAIIRKKQKEIYKDPLNHIIVSVYADRVMPTVWSKWTAKLNKNKNIDEGLKYYQWRTGYPVWDHWEDLI